MSRFLVIGSDVIGTEYARAFFATAPDETSSLMAGERRVFPMIYVVGDPAATAFDLQWYATRGDADAYQNRLTDASRLPTAVFHPDIPDVTANPTDIQNGFVALTAPTANGYVNPVGIIEMIQDTGDVIEPHIYLLQDMLMWDASENVEYRDYGFRYWIGEPPVKVFTVEWYPTRLAANLRINKLTGVSRLPRAVFTPERPNLNAGAEEVQEGTLRLYPSTARNAYGYVVGLLCVSYLTEIDVTESAVTQRAIVYSNWDRR